VKIHPLIDNKKAGFEEEDRIHPFIGRKRQDSAILERKRQDFQEFRRKSSRILEFIDDKRRNSHTVQLGH
jgi:hypothetical protein